MECDSDVLDACKDKVLQFRVKELKDVLTLVGLSKQGKKQDLVDRIVALLYDEGSLLENSVDGKEGLVEIINDVHRKMQNTGVSDSSTKKQNALGGSRIQRIEESEESYKLERKIRCYCATPSCSPLLECVDPDCDVWQHSGCVIIPENPRDKAPIPIPAQFFCELCRLDRADPFWATEAHPLFPVKLISTIPIDRTKPTQSIETTFNLTRADRDFLLKTDYDVQAWCILFNDSVQFRMQWPQYADLQVNGIPVQIASRSGSQLLGASGRDDGATITLHTTEGLNKISLSGTDARIFCFGVRIVRRQTLEQVLSMIPKEPHGEPFEAALARVQRCVGGGIPTDNNDSESDLEVIADSMTVNLRCPMSGSRMKMAGRFIGCVHMGCFDLETFVGLNERSRKWQCPICLRNYSLEDIVIDPFFNRIVNTMYSCEKEITEIDVKPDGSWRVKNARQVGNLGQWHRADGSLEILSGTENDHGSLLDCNTSKLDIHNNVDAPQGRHHSIMNQQGEVGCDQINIITMSSTTTGNSQGDEETSIHQNSGELGIYDGNEDEVTSVGGGHFRSHGRNAQNSMHPQANLDVIILSDSEDDDVSLVDPLTVPPNFFADCDGFLLPSERKILSSLTDASGEGPLIFSGKDYGQYPFLSRAQGNSGLDFFGKSGALLDEHNSGSHSQPVNPVLAPDSALDPFHLMIDLNEPVHSLLDPQFASVPGYISAEVPVPDTAVTRNEIVTNFCDGLGSLGNVANAMEGSRSNVTACHDSAGGNLLDLQSGFMSDEDSLIPKPNGESDLTLDGKRLDNRHRRSARKRTYQRVFSDDASK